MAKAGSNNLTERESQIMDVLWELGTATADQIRSRLPDALHDSTVRTLLRILETKGYIRHDVEGRAFIYRPAVERAKVQRKEVRNLLKRFFSGSARDLVLRLIEDAQLSPKQLEQLGGARPRSRRAKKSTRDLKGR